MSHVQRSGRIRGHEFDVHRATGSRVRGAEALARGNERAQTLCDRVRRDAKVDEPGSRDFGGAQPCALVVELPDQRFGDVAWLLPERAREHHRGVRRPVTERGIARALDDRVEVVGRADSAGRAL